MRRPIVDDDGHPVGVVTDRDIVIRAVAEGLDDDTAVSGIMSTALVTTTPDVTVDAVRDRLSAAQTQRVVVVGDDGTCIGVISLADLASTQDPLETGRVVSAVKGDNDGTRH